MTNNTKASATVNPYSHMTRAQRVIHFITSPDMPYAIAFVGAWVAILAISIKSLSS
jgi:hypothetical protein